VTFYSACAVRVSPGGGLAFSVPELVQRYRLRVAKPALSLRAAGDRRSVALLGSLLRACGVNRIFMRTYSSIVNAAEDSPRCLAPPFRLEARWLSAFASLLLRVCSL